MFGHDIEGHRKSLRNFLWMLRGLLEQQISANSVCNKMNRPCNLEVAH